MQLDQMLAKCKREQWSVSDLDWTVPPPQLSRDDEVAIVQYFTDMAGIERLAGALFREQQRRVADLTLKEIFSTFVSDEVRHAQVAQMLADHYNVHHYKVYQANPALVRFTPHFVDLIRYLAPEVANSYITAGELILDIALLRSLNEYVGDEMSNRAMELINRDESRHIAVDFHMVGYYASDEYAAIRRQQAPQSLAERRRALWAYVNVLYYGAPFFKAVFFEPMERVDPSGTRLREAFKRMQLLGTRADLIRNPIVRSMVAVQELYNDHDWFRALLGPLVARLIGLQPEHIARLYSDEERSETQGKSLDQMAKEALAAKYQ